MPKKSTNVEAKTVTFTFEDNGENIIFDLAKVDPSIITRLALHGLSQKGGDSYAGTAKAIAGTEVTAPEYARGQVEATIKQLYDGEWTTRTPGGGPSVTDLATALAEVSGHPLEECIERCSDASDEQKKALRAHPGIKAVMDRLRAERAAAKAAASAATAGEGPDLAEFMGD